MMISMALATMLVAVSVHAEADTPVPDVPPSPCGWLTYDDKTSSYWIILGENNNFATWPECHSGAALPTVNTTWAALRVVSGLESGSVNVTVDLNDTTFSNATCRNKILYGESMSCTFPQPQGKITVNMTSTPFGIPGGSDAWRVNGFDTARRITCDNASDSGATDPQFCSGLCGGMCGGCALWDSVAGHYNLPVINRAMFERGLKCAHVGATYRCVNNKCVQHANGSSWSTCASVCGAQ
eukprot:m.52209 g.52209  ORF g.52209 m.52209 type:complete len:240 (+) comp7358_c0_seq2:257-976(+)